MFLDIGTSTFIFLLACVLIWDVALSLRAKAKGDPLPLLHFVGTFVFVVLLCYIFSLTGIPRYAAFLTMPDLDFNFTPLLTLYTNISNTRFDLIANIIMFVPLGFLLPLLWRSFKNIFKTTLCVFCFSLFIEVSQLWTFRVTDVDDLITNTLGGLIGFALYTVTNIVLGGVYKKFKCNPEGEKGLSTLSFELLILTSLTIGVWIFLR